MICSICCNDIEYDDLIYDVSCDHKFCNDCIRRYVMDKIEEREFSILCPADSCETDISDELIEKILIDEPDVFRKYENYKNFIEKIYYMCPNCKGMCKENNYNNSVDCGWCSHTFCSVCNETHDNYFYCENESDINNVLEEIETALTECNNLVKRCPVCKTIIYKEEGCLAIRCAYCKTKFCWECLKTNYTILNSADHDCVSGGTYQFLETNSDDQYTDGYYSD